MLDMVYLSFGCSNGSHRDVMVSSAIDIMTSSTLYILGYDIWDTEDSTGILQSLMKKGCWMYIKGTFITI